MICFAGRCLAVLATPPHNIGAEGGTRTRALDVGNVGSWPLDDFRMERAARVEPVPAERQSAILPIDHSSGSLPWTRTTISAFRAQRPAIGRRGNMKLS